MKKNTAFWTALAVLLVMIAVFSQQEVVLTIREGMPIIPLAVPEFIVRDSSPGSKSMAEALRGVVLSDMTYSRVYSPLPESYYGYIRPLNPDNIFFKEWESIQAKFLLVGEVSKGEEQSLVFDAKIYDVRNSQFLFGRRYRAEITLIREVGHRLSNELMAIRGEPRIFTSKVVFVSNRDGNDELYMMDYDGRNETRLTFNRIKDYMPAWSSDGREIAHTAYRGEVAGLYILKIYEGQRLTVSERGTNFAAAYSPDGRKLAFCSTMDESNPEIYMATAQGTNVRRLTFNRAADVAPSWSPTSRQIAFTSDRGGSPQIYTMDAEGTNPRRVSFGGNYHDAPAWSPDGDRIVYVSRVNQIFDLYVLNLRTQKIIKLTEGYSRNESPSWSPDGRHLVFSSDRTGSIQLYSIDYDGTNLRRLTSQGNNKLPDWSRQ